MSTQLPPQAQMVFKGQIFETWQWEQQLYDGSTAVFERLKRTNTAEVIAVVGDKICVQRQEQPGYGEFLSLPGGRCDAGEELLPAAKRELLEETGYASNNWELFKEYQPYSKIIWTIGVFIAHNCAFAQEPQLDGGEKITNQLLTFDEFLQLPDEPAFRNMALVTDLLRARYENQKREALRALLFSI